MLAALLLYAAAAVSLNPFGGVVRGLLRPGRAGLNSPRDVQLAPRQPRPRDQERLGVALRGIRCTPDGGEIPLNPGSLDKPLRPGQVGAASPSRVFADRDSNWGGSPCLYVQQPRPRDQERLGVALRGIRCTPNGTNPARVAREANMARACGRHFPRDVQLAPRQPRPRDQERLGVALRGIRCTPDGGEIPLNPGSLDKPLRPGQVGAASPSRVFADRDSNWGGSPCLYVQQPRPRDQERLGVALRGIRCTPNGTNPARVAREANMARAHAPCPRAGSPLSWSRSALFSPAPKPVVHPVRRWSRRVIPYGLARTAAFSSLWGV